MPEQVAVACPQDYEYVFTNYRRWLYGVVYRSGVPTYMVEDAAAEVLTRMLAQDGLARFEGDLAAQPRRTKAYLATYFALGARAERSRALLQAQRNTSLEALSHTETRAEARDAMTFGHIAYDWAEEAHDEGPTDDLFQALMALSDDPDVHHIITTAHEHNGTWTKTREMLLNDGWEPLRVRAAIKKTRALITAYLCLNES